MFPESTPKKVAQFLQPYKERIEFVFLPTHSPHLNIMENFWKHLKKDGVN